MFENLHSYLIGGFPTSTSEPSAVIQRSKSLSKTSKPFLIPKRTQSLNSKSSPTNKDPEANKALKVLNTPSPEFMKAFGGREPNSTIAADKPLPSVPQKAEASKDGQREVKDNTNDKPLPALPRRVICSIWVPRDRIRVSKMFTTVKWVCCSEERHAHIEWYNQTDISICNFPACTHQRCKTCKAVGMPGWPKISDFNNGALAKEGDMMVGTVQEGTKGGKADVQIEVRKVANKKKGDDTKNVEKVEKSEKLEDDGKVEKAENVDEKKSEESDKAGGNQKDVSALTGLVPVLNTEEEFDLEKPVAESWY